MIFLDLRQQMMHEEDPLTDPTNQTLGVPWFPPHSTNLTFEGITGTTCVFPFYAINCVQCNKPYPVTPSAVITFYSILYNA
jgi:hypothetical protein